MAEYIDRQAAVDALARLCKRVCQYSEKQRQYMCGACPLGDAFTVIEDDLPAADVRPVVRGKWLNDFCGKGRFFKRIVQCSLCGNFLDLDGVNAGRGDANYCPNCWADMREES